VKEQRSRDKVAQKVGMKSRNYGKACKVVDFIDSLPCTPEKTRKIRQVLNEKSVDAAYRLIRLSPSEQDLILANEELKQTTNLPDFKLKLAHHLELDYGVLVRIYQPNNPEIHDRLGRVAEVFEKTVDIWRRDMQTMEIKKYRVHHHQAQVVNLAEYDDITSLDKRILRLRQAPLEPIDRDILDLIARAIALTPKEEKYLSMLEQEYLYNK
jgi:hypothetical protein